MDEKLWRIVPVEPTDGDRAVVDEVNAHGCNYALAIWKVAQDRGCRTERVAAACNRIKLWAEYERRTRRGIMLPEELEYFRSNLSWSPIGSSWAAFADYMQDRIGEWPARANGYSRSLIGQELQEICRDLSRLIAELAPEWDPRPSRRFVPGFPIERKAIHLASPYYRWIG